MSKRLLQGKFFSSKLLLESKNIASPQTALGRSFYLRNVTPVKQFLSNQFLRSSFQPLTRKFHTSSCVHHEDKQHIGTIKVDKPMLMIAFTCKKCDTRSSHTMSKQAYTKGTVLITCPGCKNRHLIADHLKIFSDDNVTIEDIMGAKGESVSVTTDDLAFEDIPEKLKSVIGHYAKDAPENMKQKLDNETVHSLPKKD